MLMTNKLLKTFSWLNKSKGLNITLNSVEGIIRNKKKFFSVNRNSVNQCF